jgi:hypothetical protein
MALESDNLIGHVAGQGFVEVGKAPDNGTIDQFAVNFAFIAALVTTHQQDFLILCHCSESFAEWVTFYQHVIVVLEKEHTDDFRAMGLFFELGQDHLAELVGNGVSLTGKNICNFHL